MNSEKYIGLDVHQATISVVVLDSTGKLVMESILETKAATILEFFAGLRGTLSVTFEEGAKAARIGPSVGICRSFTVMACLRLSANSSRGALSGANTAACLVYLGSRSLGISPVAHRSFLQ